MASSHPERVEASRELHVTSLREGRHRLYEFFEPAGGLAVVHNVIVIAVPEEAEAARSAYSLLLNRLETANPPEIDLKELPLARRFRLFLGPDIEAIFELEKLAEWDYSMGLMNRPVSDEEAANLSVETLD